MRRIINLLSSGVQSKVYEVDQYRLKNLTSGLVENEIPMNSGFLYFYR
jgi:hypothetical protein